MVKLILLKVALLISFVLVARYFPILRVIIGQIHNEAVFSNQNIT
jgi:hypothetical protein